METMTKDPNWVRFKLCSIEPIGENAAQLYQFKNGYEPSGYGFYGFKCVQKLDDKGLDYYEASWKCSSNCE